MTLIPQMATDRFRERFASLVVLLVIACFSVASTGCTLWKEPKNQNWNNSSGAEQYERSMWQNFRDKDWKDVEHHLAPMFVGVTPDGKKFNAAEWITRWKSVQIRDLSIGEVSVQPNGADMVITYDLRLDADGVAGKAFRVVSVWQEVKKGWILTAQSLTPVVQ